MPRSADVVESSECRQCCAFCDRVLLPSGCLESRCPYLYLYDDEHSGRRYMGCMNKVFKVEIDVEIFREAERTRHGYGGVKLSGNPTPRCRTAVERAYYGGGDAFECVNPRFFAAPEPAEAPDAEFDLRNGL